MGEQAEEREPEKLTKHICVGLLAHVDAGKTTLAESILYLTGGIRRLGRVDHGDAFLDTYEMERARGITIFSKQAEVALGDKAVTLLDTPGHVDFSAEMERTLQVLDYAVLVISGSDGIQGHVETLWRLLGRYRIPVFLFVNKMDRDGTDRQQVMEELKKRLSAGCVDFGPESREREAFEEELAVCDDRLLERYLEGEPVNEEDIRRLIGERRVFPCFFGSALKLTGVEEFLEGLSRYMAPPQYPQEFAARVYKISRDRQGTRLTHMKIIGGSLRVKSLLANRRRDWDSGKEVREEKADQLRIYSGAGYRMVDQVTAGQVCAVTGLSHTYCGQGLGMEPEAGLPLLEPVLTYRLELPEGADVHGMFCRLRELEEEEPQLHIVWNEALGEIHVQVMGDIQTEVLKSLINERFHMAVEFGTGSIVYKETIGAAVEGIGHFEPLRHYAEVHLLMEPGEPGSGMQFESACSEDRLDRNWQRLVLTHLKERRHPGVLTGAPVTDMKITLVAGRSHPKHTEGGDFRQATYRAVRQGLKKARSILLEPVYTFCLRVPSDTLGRAMTDIQRMGGSFEAPVTEGQESILAGSVPAASLGDYGRQVAVYTKGRGQLSCSLKGYEPCHNAQEVIEASGYDSESDTANPTGSVFCAHGAGYVVPWNQVDEYAHVESGLRPDQTETAKDRGTDEGGSETGPQTVPAYPAPVKASSGLTLQETEELERIFERTYGPVRRYGAWDQRRREEQGTERRQEPGGDVPRSGNRQEKEARPREDYLLVDGYNIIFSWPELKELATASLDAARGRLMDILSNYQGYHGMTLILVFDAYRVEGGVGEIFSYHNIYVVYTKEAETADQYIEKTVHAIGHKHRVTVATSDAMEQVIILGQGANRMAAREFLEEVRLTEEEMRQEYTGREKGGKNLLIDHASDDMAKLLTQVRLGKRTFQERESDE